MKKLLSIVLACSMLLGVPGCGALISALPDVIAYVQDAAQILDAIESFINSYFMIHPNPTAQQQIVEQLNKTRAALDVALRVAQGTKDLNDQQVADAFEAFKEAYLELLVLVRPYGVTMAPASGARIVYKAERIGETGSLIVPMPMAFAPRKVR